MEYERLKTEYLCYLMNRAQLDAEGPDGYLGLCKAMFECPFDPQLEMDENRCYECRELRRDFADYYCDESAGDILDGMLSETGVMLELVIVLAEKIRFDMTDSEYEAGNGKWVQEMLGNCGLAVYTNGELERIEIPFYDPITDILNTINFRTFGWDGEGSWFPLQWPKGDQRNSELIVQMNNYIEENYDIC